MRAEEQSSWEAGEPTLTAHATGAMDAPSIHLDVGTRVGRFIVRRPIGAGGMGSVYLAHDPDLDRLVALKLLHADTGDAAARERLLREAKATARLSHPNVVAVYDVGAHGDASFIALEYVAGGTLRQWLRQAPRTWQQIVQAAIHAGRGLEAAHQAGLVHRDFKPDNVLIGSDGRVRVADFGLARAHDLAGADTSVDTGVDTHGQTVQAGHMAGTPGYMAPEQLRGEEPTPRADLFAFCVTLWEALASERPFGGASLILHIEQVLRGELRPFPRDTGAPPAVIQALRRGLEVDPDARWPGMHELLAALAAALGDQGPALSQVRPFDEGPSAAMPAALGARYRLLEPLADGALGPLYRARDRLDGQLVAIRRARALDVPRTGEGESSARLALARELRQRLALRHPNLATITDFGFDDEEVAYFVLDLGDGARPLLAAARDQPLAIQAHLCGQLLRALIYLHHRGRVGVALDHETVVVVGDTLKVIDTELLEAGHAARHRRGSTLAPEVAEGAPPTVQSDLYAAGLLMAALFADQSPGDDAWQASVRSAARADDVARTLALDPPLARALARLLSPDPAARPPSAAAALDELAAATSVALPRETVHTRESFLQASALVGRDAELERLHGALRQSLRGHGHALALGGESGVGKSRLVDEIRALALVHGAVVLRGHGVREGGRLFDVWRPLLRWLAIALPLTDLEASVLRIGVPDIDALVGRAVPSAPELDATSAQLRLLQVILALLQRQVRPLVVLIDDLHWARRESVELLAALARELGDLRLLLLATYRDDEAPRLLESLPGVDGVRLGRLDRAGVQAVAAAMIGDAGRRPDLLDLLVRETEGNALFVVEVMRALAEDAGALDTIGERPLPAAIAAGGVQRVIQRRVARLSAPSRRLLEAAAVVGRDLDLDLLARLAPDPAQGEHLEEARERGALERDGAAWRFAHDKIRESLLEGLDADRRRALHEAVAAALEAREGGRDHAEALASHYRALGRHDRELVHVARAAERFARASPREGRALLERAIALGVLLRAPALDLARWRRLCADASYHAGDMAASVDEARAALAELGLGLPRGRLAWLTLLFGQVLVQLLHLARRPAAGEAPAAARRLEAAMAVGRASQISLYTFDQLALIAASLRAVNLAQSAGTTEPRAIAFLAYAVGLMGMDRLAARYFDEGLAGADDAQNVTARCDVGVMASVFATSRGDFARAEARGGESLARARASGYSLGVAQAEGILGCIAYYRGDLADFAAAYERATLAIHGAQSGHARGIEWGLCWALAERGEADAALARVEAIRAATPAGERLHLSMVHGLRADLLARRGDLEAAVEAADEAMRHADPASVPGNTPIILAGPALAYLAAWEAALTGAPALALRRRAQARRQLRALRLWSRLNPIGRPLVDLLHARAADLDGRGAAADAARHAALARAEASGLRLVAGLAHHDLARRGDPARRDHHRAAAAELLTRCGAAFRLSPGPAPA